MANQIDTTYNQQVASANSYAASAKENAKAQIDSAQAADIAAINKRYTDAVAQGDMSIKDAQIAYDKDIRALNKTYYNESKNSDLYSESMGIQGTNQALGVMAATSERQAGKVNERAIQRQNTIDDIRKQLDKIKTDTDYDINTTKSRYGSELRGMYSQIDMNRQSQISAANQWRGDKYFQQNERIAGQQFQSQESQKQRDFQAEQDRQNRDTQEKIANQNNQYHTPNEIMTYVNGHFTYNAKTKKWVSLDGKKQFDNPEQAYYSSAPQTTPMTEEEKGQYKSTQQTYAKGLTAKVIAKGDFSDLDPRDKTYKPTFSGTWSDTWNSWTGKQDYVNPGQANAGTVTVRKQDTKTYNAQAEKYSTYYKNLTPEDKALRNPPPPLLKYDEKKNKYIEYKWYDPKTNKYTTKDPSKNNK